MSAASVWETAIKVGKGKLIIAQARARGLPVVTGDRAFGAYDVEVLW